jgi:hypothetical protein
MSDTIQDTIKNAKKLPGFSTLIHLPISEIRDDTIVLKNGGLRTVLETSSINFNLKSEEEQNSIIYSYQHFLNTLEFPIQIVVRSRKLDIDNYIEEIKEKSKTQQNALLKRQTLEYAEYIQKLVEYADIMDKSFYVIVPYNPLRANKKNIFSKFMERMKTKDSVIEIQRRRGEFVQLHKSLVQRVNLIKAGLQNCGLTARELTTPELIQLFYTVYNPVSSRYQKCSQIENLSLEKD